jgi:hypothetical protein
MRIIGAIVLTLSAVWPATAAAQRSSAAAVALDGDAVTVDGRLTEPVWQRAEWEHQFQQRDPVEGAPAAESTEVAFAFDDHAICGFGGEYESFFLVWQQDRATRLASANAVGPGALWNAFRVPGSHRLLAKVSYWLSP